MPEVVHRQERESTFPNKDGRMNYALALRQKLKCYFVHGDEMVSRTKKVLTADFLGRVIRILFTFRSICTQIRIASTIRTRLIH